MILNPGPSLDAESSLLTHVAANTLVLDHVHFKKLDLPRCALGDAGLSKLWTGLAGQAESLEWLDTSENHGVARFEIVQRTLRQLRRITKLNIAGNTRITSDESLFDKTSIGSWALRDLDLSGIAVRGTRLCAWKL